MELEATIFPEAEESLDQYGKPLLLPCNEHNVYLTKDVIPNEFASSRKGGQSLTSSRILMTGKRAGASFLIFVALMSLCGRFPGGNFILSKNVASLKHLPL